MPWNTTLNLAQKMIIIQTWGTFKLEDANRMRNEGAALIRQHGLLQGLLDHSQLEAYTLQTMEIYELPKRYQELGISHRFKLAVVVPEMLRRDMAFYETVCRNNGYLVSVFFEQGEALAWFLS
ncbi:MAG: hypothetical protein H6636_02925 [Anaerolineales bacterium]|nr:hypothetical protein [Anaerolineales bacterium]